MDINSAKLGATIMMWIGVSITKKYLGWALFITFFMWT